MQNDMECTDFANLTVLVAEPSSYMRQTMRGILRTFNIGHVAEADTPERAWDFFQTRRPDVVFADWSETCDGISLLKRIRRDDDSVNPFTSVVVMTSMTDQEHVLTARDLGATEFLAKPYSPRMIFLRLKIISEKPRPFVRAGDFFGPDRRRREVGTNQERRDHFDAHILPKMPAIARSKSPETL